MNTLILGAFGINALLVSLLMVVFYQSVKDELNSGFRGYLNKRREKNKVDNASEFQMQKRTDNDSHFNHWDLSGGIMGI